jgi:hypothetical protein
MVGRQPLKLLMKVRLLLPEPDEVIHAPVVKRTSRGFAKAEARVRLPAGVLFRKGKPIGDGNRLLRGRAATPCRFNSCPFRL